jgi:hypothetical protein
VRPLLAAELLRLRTVRSSRWVFLGGLAVVAAVAASNVRADATWSPGELADSLRAFALTGVLIPSAFAGGIVGSGFQRGEVAMTYLTHPRRTRPAAAQALVHAGLGLLFAGLAAVIVVAVALAIAGARDVSAADVVRLVGGAAAGGAVMSGAGVLLGTATRNATIASGGLIVLEIVESLVRANGLHHYLPFGLLDSLMGSGAGAPPAAALLLLLAYLAAFALCVRKWALPRDLT